MIKLKMNNSYNEEAEKGTYWCFLVSISKTFFHDSSRSLPIQSTFLFFFCFSNDPIQPIAQINNLAACSYGPTTSIWLGKVFLLLFMKCHCSLSIDVIFYESERFYGNRRYVIGSRMV